MTGAARGSVPVAPPPEPADVGVVAALPMEVAPFVARFKNIRKYSSDRHTVTEGECGGKLVAVMSAGPGRKAAARAATTLLTGHRPHWIISTGFAGALDPSLSRNQILLASEVVDTESLRLAIDVRLPSESQPRGLSTGRLLTVDQIVRTAAEKAELRRMHHADAVDMETSAVAALCAERRVRFLAIRVISDDASTDLPPEVLSILGRSGGYRIGAAVGAVWRRPGSVKDLWALREHAVAAADRLGRFLAEAVRELP
jgi:adenosylhomocysteine nucleosidase